MSGNPFDPEGTSGEHVGTIGAPTGFSENFHAVLQQAINNDSSLDIERDAQSRWHDSLNALRQRGVEVPDNNALRLIEDNLDPDGEHYIRRSFLGVDDQSKAAEFEAASKLNDQIKALGDPNIHSIEQILDEVKQARLSREQDVAEVTEAGSGIASFLGRLAGGAVGAMTDPAQLPALLAGGIGKTVAMRLGSEVLTNAAVAGGIQAEVINPEHQMLGEPQGSVLGAAVVGGLAGGLFGGLREGIGGLAALAADRLPRSPDVEFHFDDPQLRQMFEQAPDSPLKRAGLETLDEQAHFDHNNPYPDTETGLRRFTGEVEDITKAFGGTDTAIDKLLPPIDEYTYDNLDFHTQVAKEQSPELFNRLEQATSRLSDIDEQISATQSALESLTVGRVLQKVDEETAQIVQSYEQDLANPMLGQAEKAAIQQKIDGIVESVRAVPEDRTAEIAAAEDRLQGAATKAERSAALRDLDKLYKKLGEDVLQSAFDATQIPMKKQLQSLRASRKAAAKEFREARNAMDKAIERVKAEERVKELLRTQLGIGQKRTPFDVEVVRGDRVAQAVRVTEQAYDSMVKGNDGEALVKAEPPKASSEVTEPETTVPEGMVDLGGGLVLPKDFKFSDPDGVLGETTAGELFSRMQSDERLAEAMRTCAI